MNKQQQKLAQEILAAIKDIDLQFNIDIHIEVTDEISIKVSDHVYGE